MRESYVLHVGIVLVLLFPTVAGDCTPVGQGGEKRMEKRWKAMKFVASVATIVVLRNPGHWVLEENPKETTDALMNFL